MELKTKHIFIFLMFFLVITNVYALDVLKPAKVNQSYTVLQTCSSCSYINITISNVNGLVVSNKAMTNNGSGVWIYDITPSIISRHDVTGQGDKDGVDTSFATFFEVSPSGKVVSTGDSILYFLFSIILFGVISVVSFFVATLPSENERDDRGFETKIIRLKYIRVLLIFILYPLTILMLNFLNGLAVNFTALSIFSGILGFCFETLLTLSWPFTIIIVAWIVIMLIHDTNVNKQLDKFMGIVNVPYE